MTLLRTEMVPNGEIFTSVRYYQCDNCSDEIYEGFPHTVVKKVNHYCKECSYILGLVTEKWYLNCSGIGISGVKATVHEGKVAIWRGKKAPWEQTNDDVRRSGRYKKWRVNVFKRDDYTCQHCRQEGGELNAHHIKPFAKYKKLRFEITNGLTLCVQCHREEHKQKR